MKEIKLNKKKTAVVVASFLHQNGDIFQMCFLRKANTALPDS